MKKLGILGAMELEVETLVAQLEDKTVSTLAGSTFYSGKLEGLDVVVVQCGIGKVNAALCVQTLVDRFQITHLVNTGIAGSLSSKLDIGDLVVSRDAMYHDFDCCAFGYAFGNVPGMPLRFAADEELIACAQRAAEEIHPGHSCVGSIASGDQFVSSASVKQRIVENTGAICTEMEGAAIAHAAYRNSIPFVILRAISDKADADAEMDYPTFERQAAHRCAAVTKNLARQLAES